MVGVWTAQRVSDYNNLSKDSIHTYTKRWIEDVPDPLNPGKTKPEIKEKDITYIDIRQKKTGAKVAIPCSRELLEILKKYDFQIPHLEDQVINRYLKETGNQNMSWSTHIPPEEQAQPLCICPVWTSTT